MHFAVSTHPDGFITMPCCRFRLGSDSEYRKHKFQQPEQAVSKNGYFEDIRKKMLAGKKLHGCQKCWREEEHKGYSYRTLMFDRLNIDQIDTQSAFNLKYLEIFFSNLCNLSCRMCDIMQSSQWANLYNNAFIPEGITDNQVVPEEYLDENGRAKTSPVSFDLKLLDKLDLSNLIEVKILGGEPMITPDHLVFLERLMKDSKQPNKIKLVYHTNATKRPPQQVIDYWKQMEKIEIVCSIDGYGEVNEYQRIGSNFEVIQQNIDWYRSLDANIELRIHSTISILNIWKIDDLVKWGKTATTENISFDFVQRPSYLDVTIMPDSAKEKCVRVIESADNLQQSQKQFILAYLNSKSYNIEHWKEFWNRMTAIDKYTKQSLNKIAPQLEEFKI
jgi:organic radical activating enzyme